MGPFRQLDKIGSGRVPTLRIMDLTFGPASWAPYPALALPPARGSHDLTVSQCGGGAGGGGGLSNRPCCSDRSAGQIYRSAHRNDPHKACSHAVLNVR
jgi:hypothetical protein